MADILIKKFNNVFLEIEADNSIKMALYEHFSRFVKGYNFSPKYKARIWDGKIRFFNYKTGRIYVGLIHDILEFCKQNDYKVKVEDDVKKLFSFDLKEEKIKEYLDNLVLSSNNERIFLRDYQEKAIISSLLQKRRLIQSPTGSGKSSIIYTITKFLFDEVFDKNEKILIIVPTINLVNQLYSDFKDYSTLNDWAVADFVSNSLQKSKIIKRIHITTWQSIYNLNDEWFKDFRCLIVDEAHLAKAKSLVKIGEKCNAEFRFGLSGSFEENDETSFMTLKGIFGFLLRTTTTKELIEKKYLANLKINCLQISYKDNNMKNFNSYKDEIDWIVKNEKRNSLIVEYANSLDGNVLILFNLVEKHGKVLLEMAKEKEKEIFFVYGGTQADQRENIRKIAENHKGCIILASYQTFSTGVNIKNLEHIIFASPTKSFTRVIQSIGRGLRISERKRSCEVHDFSDFIYKTNFTFRHFLERIKIYRKENFNFKIEKVSL